MTENEQQNIFNDWLRQHKALLFKVLRVYAPDEDDRNDLFQEIAIQVWRSVPNFRQESSVSTWIYRIALNTAIKWSLREKKINNPKESLENNEHLLYEDKKSDDRLVWLYEEIEKLNEIDRSLTLLMLDGYSYTEMSEILGISESLVGVKIHRIKKHFIKKSEEYEQHGV